jgi:hypothetical protein
MMMQMAVYAGFPAALNGLFSQRKRFSANARANPHESDLSQPNGRGLRRCEPSCKIADKERVMQIVLIDKFVVPEESRALFLQEARKCARFLRTLPGYVEGYFYEKQCGESRFNIMTSAVWESEKPLRMQDGRL